MIATASPSFVPLKRIPCRVLQKWSKHKPGDIITPIGALRTTLLKRGVIEIVKEADEQGAHTVSTLGLEPPISAAATIANADGQGETKPTKPRKKAAKK